ncbi:universal stress protein [soil metagenome]
MKTILVPTDFSQPAENAARYAIQLAGGLITNIKLVNAFKVPAEAPMAAKVVWPLEDYSSLKNDITGELALLADRLINEEKTKLSQQAYHPLIEYTCGVGSLTEVVRNLTNEQKYAMLVMGMSGAGGLSNFFWGSNSREMIEKANFPVLLIPAETTFNGISKIAFASDLGNDDIHAIHCLAGLARKFNAEIQVVHITDEKYDEVEHQEKTDAFLDHIKARIDYPKIYYRHVKSINVGHGLDWLTEHGQVEMVAMVHRHHNIFDQIFSGSHTQRLARHIDLPLLAFPAGYRAVV